MNPKFFGNLALLFYSSFSSLEGKILGLYGVAVQLALLSLSSYGLGLVFSSSGMV